MAQLGQTINRSELPVDEGGGDFSPLPEGWYDTKITGSELKDTKSGTGQYIKVEFTVIGADFSGRKVWGMLNIRNDNEKAESIGRQQLNSLMAAIGLESLSDTDDLIGADVSIKVKIKPASGDYKAGNDVGGYKALEGKTPDVPATAPANPAPAKSTPPWSK